MTIYPGLDSCLNGSSTKLNDVHFLHPIAQKFWGWCMRAKKTAPCGRPSLHFLSRPRLCVFECLRLFDPDHTKRSCQIIVRTGGKEELIRTAVIRRSSSELNSPELVDDDILAVHIPDRAHKLSGDEIKGIDGAVVRIV